MNKFPKNIFQVWYQGCDTITKNNFLENIKNWKNMNKYWNYRCVDDKFLEQSCLQFSKECYDAYKLANVMHIKIDLGRYVLIYLYGGIYIDMDAYILRGLDTSDYVNQVIDIYEKDNKNVLAISQASTTSLESYFTVQYSKTLNNAIMMSSPKNPVLEKFIKQTIQKINDNYSENVLGKSTENSAIYVSKTTGPFMFNYFFQNLNNLTNSELVIFPPHVFEPCDLEQHCTINDKTVSIHLFEQSWIPYSVSVFRDVYYFCKPHFISIILFIFFLYYINKKKK